MTFLSIALFFLYLKFVENFEATQYFEIFTVNSKPIGDSVRKHSSAAACDAEAVDLDLLVEPNLL